MEGQLQVKGRFGFLLSEDPSIPDVYIGPDTLRLAMPGDRVMARVRIIAGGVRPEGDIVRVLKRARSTMVGVCESTDKGDVIRPEMGTTAVRIIDRGGLQFGAGDALVVRISTWPTMDRPAEGAVIEVLGKPDDAGVDMVMIIRKNELNESFPPDVVREASAFGTEVPESALAGRETFFHLPVVTIDGEDAQDFDDAVSLESAPDGGWKLGVHIADVAHYVREGTALDEEALKRATSVYMPGKVIPMLPPNLSDHLCSLRPNVLRLTLSCIMELAADGRVTGSRIVKSAIRSSRRFTYEEVETILRNQGTAGASPEIVRDVEAMGKLARILRERRIKRGALDLDFPEAKIVLDVRGRPIDARRRTRLESHRLVEELMLLANESVAELMKEKPFLYRIHERPAPEKLGKLSQTLKAYDVPVPPDFEKGNSLSLQKTLKAVVGSPIEAVIHMMCLRSLMKAIYSPVNVGHYGLASPCYTHFTSPIRRYPDLCIHRIIAEWLISPLSPERQSHWKLALPEIAKRSSFRERLAQETERESLELNRVQLMKERVGETFDGIIMGVAPFGFFVQLDEIFVEGMVPVASLSDDYYVYDEVRATLKGRRTGRVFLMGQKVRVRLAAANAAKRQLEFAYGDGPSKDVRAGAHKPHGGGGRRRRGR